MIDIGKLCVSESEWFTGDTPNCQFFTRGMRQEGNKSLALTRDANLDTQSSDISAEEIRESGCLESGRSFQSLIVCGKKLVL